ncbi:MAG: hypothetical protein HZB20_08025 [Chloroflexi bacterium]|nr:hypothetical protein [Chloroflexota bacterium]
MPYTLGMASELRLSLLGGVHITLGDKPVTGFVSNKALALLCYLAVTARPHQRDFLAGLFWGESSDADAKASLRQALANLRRLLGDYLEIDRQTTALNRALPHWVDVAEFERLAGGNQQSTINNQQSAIGLYRGDFLAGLVLRDALAFDEWATVERERLHGLAVRTLRMVWRHTIRGRTITRPPFPSRAVGSGWSRGTKKPTGG